MKLFYFLKIFLCNLFLLKSKYLYFNLISSPYSISEFTGNGKISDLDKTFKSIYIELQFPQLIRFLLIVSLDLLKLLPVIFITVS